jgi:hypothetical protein
MTESIEKLLSEDVPPEHITQRSGGGGIKLDYVTGRYVKQRLNEIFGWDGWFYEVVTYELFPEECTAFVHVRLHIRVEKSGDGDEAGHRWITRSSTSRDGLAYGHGRKGPEGFDFAIAEAVTDALKRAAVSLGQNMGLSLYPYAKGSKDDHKPEPKLPPADEKKTLDRLISSIAGATTKDGLGLVAKAIKDSGLSDKALKGLRSLYAGKSNELDMEEMDHG